MLGDYRKLLYEQEEAPKKAPAPEEEDSFDDYVDKEEMNKLLKASQAKAITGKKEKINVKPEIKEYVGHLHAIRNVLASDQTQPEEVEELDEAISDWFPSFMSKMGLFGSKAKADAWANDAAVLKSKKEIVDMSKEMAKDMADEENDTPAKKQAAAWGSAASEMGLDKDGLKDMMKSGGVEDEELLNAADKAGEEKRKGDPKLAEKYGEAKKKLEDAKKASDDEESNALDQEQRALDQEAADVNVQTAQGESDKVSTDNAAADNETLKDDIARKQKELKDKVAKNGKSDSTFGGLLQNTKSKQEREAAATPPEGEGGEEKPEGEGGEEKPEGEGGEEKPPANGNGNGKEPEPGEPGGEKITDQGDAETYYTEKGKSPDGWTWKFKVGGKVANAKNSDQTGELVQTESKKMDIYNTIMEVQVSEGYESSILAILDDEGIEGPLGFDPFFEKGKLHVAKGEEKNATKALKNSRKIKKLPKIVGEEVEIEEAQSGDKDEYEKFFKGALKKFGVDSPAELKGDKEKEFYDYVDKNWKGADEQTEEIEMSKEDAAAFMSAASKAKEQGKKKFKMGGKEYPVTIKIKIPEEVEIDEGAMLQAKMALGDADIKHKEHNGKIIINKKDKKKAQDVLIKSFSKKGKPPKLTIASGSFQEEVELDEIAPWKKGKYKVTDGKTGKVLGTFSSGEKAQKYVDKIWDKGDYDSLTVELGEEVVYTRGVEIDEAVNLKKLKKEYDKNEDKNYHTENYLLLAKAFGTPAEVKKVEEILKRNEKQGSTSKSDMDWMYKNINKYYDKIRNEEVEMEQVEVDGRKRGFKEALKRLTYLKNKKNITEAETFTIKATAGKKVKDVVDDVEKNEISDVVQMYQDMYPRAVISVENRRGKAISSYKPGEKVKESVWEAYARLGKIPSKYTKRSGLEGPIMTTSGKVVYYDPKEGSYYDPDSDWYISDTDYKALDDPNNATWHTSPLTDPRSKEYKHMQKQLKKGGKRAGIHESASMRHLIRHKYKQQEAKQMLEQIEQSLNEDKNDRRT